MKKNIVIIVLILFASTMTIYAFIKSSEAEKNLILAQEQKELAEQNAQEAEESRQKAMEAAAEAQRVMMLAQKAAADCESKLKGK